MRLSISEKIAGIDRPLTPDVVSAVRAVVIPRPSIRDEAIEAVARSSPLQGLNRDSAGRLIAVACELVIPLISPKKDIIRLKELVHPTVTLVRVLSQRNEEVRLGAYDYLEYQVRLTSTEKRLLSRKGGAGASIQTPWWTDALRVAIGDGII